MKLLHKNMVVEDIMFKRTLRKLQAEEQAIIDAYDPYIQKARAEKNWDEENSIASRMFYEQDQVRNEIRSLQHKYITIQADRMLLPIPTLDTKSSEWVRSDFDGRWTLSSDVLARLGREVRQERRERLELTFLWPSAMIGLVGGLIGMFTAFWK